MPSWVPTPSFNLFQKLIYKRSEEKKYCRGDNTLHLLFIHALRGDSTVWLCIYKITSLNVVNSFVHTNDISNKSLK